MSDVRPGSARAWLLASRPATLSAALVPVAVGTACADSQGGVAWLAAAAALFGACMIQIGTNFANDVFDFEKGTDDEQRLGPVRAAQAGLLTAAQLKRGMFVSFGLATAAGVYLVWIGGWPVVAIGVASVLSGIAYTGGPFPLGYHGLGDVFVMLFFGLVAVCGTEYVQLVQQVPAPPHLPAQLPTPLALYASLPVGALATAILVVNNLRDRVGDARSGKRTLAVRLGATGARLEYLLLIVVTYAVPLYLFHAGLVGSLIFVVFVTSPAAAVLLRAVWVRDGAELNSALTGTAKLLLAYGLLFALGISVTT
ncbi:MAG: 1,4-dihydroxy-2-naphthoate polyprenyltransferase [Myxococcales bacterium]|nr:1,4-dihydroxy-2-naphthoate polyprenyltransferase [Myxococcales bacterium]MCB9627552.1 1,4-dihydroxy-2-naphthoate polyprenyltransferase [Sandaracinaceae bacterium]